MLTPWALCITGVCGIRPHQGNEHYQPNEVVVLYGEFHSKGVKGLESEKSANVFLHLI